MISKPSQAKRLESAISICLLAILLLIGIGVFLKQFDVDMSRFGIETTTTLESEIPFESSTLTPAGFEALSETEVYDSENLYEKINGKAALYTESGFQQLFTQRYVSKADEDLITELYVYDMADVRNAFSVYSVQRRMDVDVLSAFPASYAYRTGNALYFVYGKYYIELVGFSESDKLFEAMMETGQKIQASLAADGDTEIAELNLFPTDDIVQGSAKLYLANGLAFEGLTDTFAAQYKFADEIVTAFLSKRANAKEAQTIAEDYYKFLIDNGGAENIVPLAGKFPGKMIDFYGTTEIIFAIGPFVGGVHEAESQECAVKLACLLFNKLAEESNAVKR